jgi:hypothetical protein
MLGQISQIQEIVDNGIKIIEKLNGSRSVLLELWNHTDYTLRVDSHHHAHGGFEEPPDIEVPPQMVSSFGSQSKAWSIWTGTEGSVTYDVIEQGALATVRWNNPFYGSNSCRGKMAGEKALSFEVTSICGAGNEHAKMKYELRQVLDPRFVRAPDYRWVRLEGFAFDPTHGWWGDADPDAASDDAYPFPHRVVELHSWYSPSREDNWATSDPQYARRLMDNLLPDYKRYRFEGYIISPSVDSPSGTVPLHSWWSKSREDNWTTANPQFTRPLDRNLDPDYATYRLEGFLFAPDRPAPPHTVPVHSWYSASRSDNFITTDGAYRP